MTPTDDAVVEAVAQLLPSYIMSGLPYPKAKRERMALAGRMIAAYRQAMRERGGGGMSRGTVIEHNDRVFAPQ